MVSGHVDSGHGANPFALREDLHRRSGVRALLGLRAQPAEIERWTAYSDAERDRVMDELPGRLEAMQAAPRAAKPIG